MSESYPSPTPDDMPLERIVRPGAPVAKLWPQGALSHEAFELGSELVIRQPDGGLKHIPVTRETSLPKTWDDGGWD